MHKWKGWQPPWLSGEKRRTLKDIHRYASPKQIYNIIVKGKKWPYKSTPEYFLNRDRAFLSLLFLSGLRVNEVLKIMKDQFDLSHDDFVLIKDVEISKRKAETIRAKGIPKIDIPLPLSGELFLFTDIIMNYYKICKTEKLFPFGTGRALVLTKHITGKWNHFFRSQRLSDMVNRQKIRVQSTAKIVGIENVATITHYDKGTWEEHKEELLT